METGGGEPQRRLDKMNDCVCVWVRFLDIDRLVNAIQSTGTTVLVLNKWDILILDMQD